MRVPSARDTAARSSLRPVLVLALIAILLAALFVDLVPLDGTQRLVLALALASAALLGTAAGAWAGYRLGLARGAATGKRDRDGKRDPVPARD